MALTLIKEDGTGKVDANGCCGRAALQFVSRGFVRYTVLECIDGLSSLQLEPEIIGCGESVGASKKSKQRVIRLLEEIEPQICTCPFRLIVPSGHASPLSSISHKIVGPIKTLHRIEECGFRDIVMFEINAQQTASLELEEEIRLLGHEMNIAVFGFLGRDVYNLKMAAGKAIADQIPKSRKIGSVLGVVSCFYYTQCRRWRHAQAKPTKLSSTKPQILMVNFTFRRSRLTAGYEEKRHHKHEVLDMMHRRVLEARRLESKFLECFNN